MINGYTLYEGPSLIDAEPIVTVVTGIAKQSDNPKTGPMLQTWILKADKHPSEAGKDGSDTSICGTCPLRMNAEGKRACYVQLWQAPTQVWKAYRAGKYPTLNTDHYEEVFLDKNVRLGAYGDPAAVPIGMWQQIVYWAKNHTGYTHQWLRCDQRMKSFCMASVDTDAQASEARMMGWRTFRVGSQPLLGEILCPASEEAGKRTTCDKCRLCNGSNTDGKPDSRKSIYIPPHGSGKKLWQNAATQFVSIA